MPVGTQTDPHRLVTEFPDIETITGRYLRDQFGSDAYVYTVLPSTVTYDKPVIRALRIGGQQSWPVIDNPQVDFDVWARTLAEVKAAVSRARAYCQAMKGFTYMGGVITRTEEFAGPVRRPETDEGLERIGFSFAFGLQKI
jgi:hypothetical protein